MNHLITTLVVSLLALISGCTNNGAVSSANVAEVNQTQEASATAHAQISPVGFIGDIVGGTLGIADGIVDKSVASTLPDDDDLSKETITGADVGNVKLDSINAAIYIEPSADADIHLAYTSSSDFHIIHKIENGTLSISDDASLPDITGLEPTDVLKVSIPRDLIKRLDIAGGASYIHLVGQEGMMEACVIDVSASAVYLENIYADTTVKTKTGTIRVNNDTVKSNLNLKSQIGVIDVTLGKLPDNVSLYTEGTVSRNTFLETHDGVSPNEQYTVMAESSLGMINLHE